MATKIEKASEEKAPQTGKYIIDRVVWHTPGKAPYALGSEQELPVEDVAHLVAGGFIHLVGTDPAPHSAAANGQQVSTPLPPATIAPPFAAAPLTYANPGPAKA